MRTRSDISNCFSTMSVNSRYVGEQARSWLCQVESSSSNWGFPVASVQLATLSPPKMTSTCVPKNRFFPAYFTVTLDKVWPAGILKYFIYYSKLLQGSHHQLEKNENDPEVRSLSKARQFISLSSVHAPPHVPMIMQKYILGSLRAQQPQNLVTLVVQPETALRATADQYSSVIKEHLNV